MRELRTDRLILRRWLADDRVPFAELNSDPRVMEFFPAALSREESDALADRIHAHFERHQFGLWAMEIPQRTAFAGFVGLAVPGFKAPFMPCVEIGWRLASEHWGFGYATEAARAVLTFGFDSLALDEIVSFTTPHNCRSRRVMERIGMAHNPADDFDHPGLPEGHPLRRHVLYRLRRPWSTCHDRTQRSQRTQSKDRISLRPSRPLRSTAASFRSDTLLAASRP